MKSLHDWMVDNQKTLADVARLCGVRADTVNGWLTSNRKPIETHRKALRRMTNGEVDYPIPELAPAAYRRSFTLVPPAQSPAH